jgi:GAF domain
MIETKAVVHVADAKDQPGYAIEHDPASVAAVELGGVRTVLYVPMLKENEVVGAFTLSRQEVRPFTDKQIALVTNFAAQAVIAIENARLLNELRQRTNDLSQRTTDLTEALEQQTATSSVLGVISSSRGDLEPVFQSLLQNSMSVCHANFGNLALCEGDGFRNVAIHNAVPVADEFFRGQLIHPHPESPLSLAARNKQPSHVHDLRTTSPYLAGNKGIVMLADVWGARTFLCVPLL